MYMPDTVAALLVDPQVRQLVTSNPDEMPAGGAVGAALDCARITPISRKPRPNGSG